MISSPDCRRMSVRVSSGNQNLCIRLEPVLGQSTVTVPLVLSTELISPEAWSSELSFGLNGKSGPGITLRPTIGSPAVRIAGEEWREGWCENGWRGVEGGVV